MIWRDVKEGGPGLIELLPWFQKVSLRCLTPRLHCFLSSHWSSFRFHSFTAFLIPYIQFFFGLSRALFCFGIHFNAVLGNLPSAILWTWPYHVSWFCSISFTIVSSSPIFFCLIVTFLILSFLDIFEDLLRASISVASTRLLLCSVSLHVSEPYNKLLLINVISKLFQNEYFLRNVMRLLLCIEHRQETVSVFFLPLHFHMFLFLLQQQQQ